MAAFDIPLTALSLIKSGFMSLDISCLATDCTDTAYADDLVSVCASPEALQDKADVMSAWCLLSGVKMNTSKLRTYGITWGPSENQTETLKIHGEDWEEICIAINHDGFMTQLGVLWDMDMNNNKQCEFLKERLEEIGARIIRFRGRVGDKLLALEYCLRSNVAYSLRMGH